MSAEEKKQALERYFVRQLQYMKRCDDVSTKVLFFHQCFGAVSVIISVSPAEELKVFEELWDEWKQKLEAEAYGL